MTFDHLEIGSIPIDPNMIFDHSEIGSIPIDPILS